jgi:hypothetical protein
VKDIPLIILVRRAYFLALHPVIFFETADQYQYLTIDKCAGKLTDVS